MTSVTSVTSVNRALAIAVAAALAAPAHAEAPPGQTARVAYLAGVLEALEATDPAELAGTSNYIYGVERNKCQAPVESLRVDCLLEAARRGCAQRARPAQARARCEQASDVIVTNRLSERVLIPEDVRYALMDQHRDYRAAIERELTRRHAQIAAELVTSRHFPGSAADRTALAAGIDGYCREVAGSRALSWQYCVAAVVWFITTSGAAPASRGAAP